MSEIVEQKLQILINLQARALVRDYDKQIEKIDFLSSCGIGNQDIAEILGTTPNTVSVAKAKLKKTKLKEAKNE